MFKVIEKFVSIDGEGPSSGELATFIRFAGCNLECSWCDTTYSWNSDAKWEVLQAEEIYEYIKESGVRNVTLTGGEPLIQPHIHILLDILSKDNSLVVHVETNGSVDLKKFKEAYKDTNISYIVDFKLPQSQMTSHMNLHNLVQVGLKDVYKFVIAGQEDLLMANSIIQKYALTSHCLVYFSPVSNLIRAEDIVEFMKEHQLNGVRLQLQLHKYIWEPTMRGV